MTTITALVKSSHANAIEKGWWGDPENPDDRNIGELMMLMVTEVSEAFEEYRNGHGNDEVYTVEYTAVFRDAGEDDLPSESEGPEWTISKVPYTERHEGRKKPEGIPIELADVVIRIADFCGRYGIDLQEAIRVKAAYNATRPHRHGGKRA